MPDHRRSAPSFKRAARLAGRVLVSLGIVAGIAGATSLAIGAIRADALAQERAIQAAPRAVAVGTTRATFDGGYEVERRYTGQIALERTASLSFEVSRQVIDAPLTIGDRVGAGDVVGRIDARRLEASIAETASRLERAEATRDLAATELGRSRTLFERGVATQATVDAARTRLSEVEQDAQALRAQIARLELDLEDTILRAPFAGTVTSLDFELGDVVAPGAPVMRLADLDGLNAQIGLPLAMSRNLSEGQSVTVILRGTEIQATVDAVVPQVAAASQTVLAVIDLPRGIEAVDGEQVTLSLGQLIARQGVWVPLDALVSDLRGLFAVQVAHPGEGGVARVARAPVQVHHTDGSRAYVSGAIEEGDAIVTRGTNRVSPGQIVAAEARP